MIFSSIDTETTGLAREDKVINFGATVVETDNLKGIAELVGFIDVYNMVNCTITAGARAVHGIDYNRLRILSGEKKAYEVVDQIEPVLLLPDYIVGYNTMFDLRMIANTYPSIPLEKIRGKIDVMDDVKRHYGKRRKLESIVEENSWIMESFLKDSDGQDLKAAAHSAVFDSYATIRLYLHMKGYKWV